jgi:hypothetical protein
MERWLQNALFSWKNDPNRLPLIIQGARQVGILKSMPISILMNALN